MEFSCSECNYTSDSKRNVERHIKARHNNAYIEEIEIDIVCEYCDKQFSTKPSMKRHLKNCKVKKANLEKQLKEKDEEIKDLKNKLKEKNDITNNINVTQNINIQINNYDNTNLEKLTDRVYNKIITDAEEVYQIIPSLIRHIHFNPQTPENYNIFITNRNKNNKHLQMFRNGHWEIANKITEIDNIISDKETHLSDWVLEKGSKYPEAKERYDEYLEQKYEPDTAKLIREEVELILYNNRHLIKS